MEIIKVNQSEQYFKEAQVIAVQVKKICPIVEKLRNNRSGI
jgi:hypothetical protein